MAFIAPKIIGRISAPSPVGELNLTAVTDALQLKNVEGKAIADEISIKG